MKKTKKKCFLRLYFSHTSMHLDILFETRVATPCWPLERIHLTGHLLSTVCALHERSEVEAIL